MANYKMFFYSRLHWKIHVEKNHAVKGQKKGRKRAEKGRKWQKRAE